MTRIRLLGFAKLAVGVFLTIFVYQHLLDNFDYSQKYSSVRKPAVGIHMGIVTITAILALVGLLEVIAGAKFYQITNKWDTLHGGIQWILSCLLILIVLGTCFGFFAYLLRDM